MPIADRQIDLLEAPGIRQYAKVQRRHLGWENLDRIDPLSLKAVSEIWTVRGRTPFRLYFVPNEELPGDPAFTICDGSTLVVKIADRIRRAAFLGDGYARFVVARELGKASLRHPEMLMGLAKRRCGEAEDARQVTVSALISMQFQASVFAASLLIRDEIAHRLPSLEEVSIQAGIDPLCARRYFAPIADFARAGAAGPR
jgi:hypothetical protein